MYMLSCMCVCSCLFLCCVLDIIDNAFYDIVGGWPLIGLPDVDGVPWDLNGEEFLQEKLFGSPALFTLSIYFDLEKTSRFIIYVSECN